MRALLDSILSFIGAASLSDVEFDGLTLESFAYDIASYGALLAVLIARESVSSTTDRLRYYYLGKGVEVSAPELGTSNILVGGVLC